MTRELKQLVHEGFTISEKTDFQTREVIYDIAIQKNLRENTLLVPDINENGDFNVFESLEPPVRSILASKIWQGTDHTATGVIILESGSPGNFESYDQQTLFELANYGSIASQVAQSFKGKEAQSFLQRNLLEAMKIILAQRSHEQMMLVADKIRQAFNCEIVTFYEYDAIKGEIIFSGFVGKFRKPKKVRNNGKVPPGTVVEKLLINGEPIFAPNAEKHPLFSRGDFIKDEHIIASAGIPLLAGEERVGVLFINFRQKHEFSDEEQSTVLLFASLAALAIQNSRLYEITDKRSKQLKEIHEASKEIVANLDLGFYEILVKTAVEKVISASGVKPVIGTFHVKKGDVLHLESSYPLQNWPESADQAGKIIRLTSSEKIGIIGQAAVLKNLVNVDDVTKNDNYLRLIESTVSELAVPLLDGNNVLGVINLELNEPARFSKEDENGINTLADLAVVAIQYKQKTEQLVLSTDVALMGAWGAEILHDVKEFNRKDPLGGQWFTGFSIHCR